MTRSGRAAAAGVALTAALAAGCGGGAHRAAAPATVSGPAASAAGSPAVRTPAAPRTTTPRTTIPRTTTPRTTAAARRGAAKAAATPRPSRSPDRSVARRPSPTPAAAGRPLAGRVIALDPGHNGGNAAHPAQIDRLVDAGGFRKACNSTGTATDGGYPESLFAWRLALRLRADLEREGATVRLTRTDDTGWGPCIDDRGRFAGRVGADVLVSLHGDGGPASGHGFTVLEPALRRGWTDDILPASDRLGTDLRDGLVAAGFDQSTYYGSHGLIARSDLGTLNWSAVPAVMVECGNMRNGADAASMTSTAGQRRLAAALAAGLNRFLTR